MARNKVTSETTTPKTPRVKKPVSPEVQARRDENKKARQGIKDEAAQKLKALKLSANSGKVLEHIVAKLLPKLTAEHRVDLSEQLTNLCE